AARTYIWAARKDNLGKSGSNGFSYCQGVLKLGELSYAGTQANHDRMCFQIGGVTHDVRLLTLFCRHSNTA
ncbi:hypothetical protein, partial [Ruegeria atlantica]|uniref:hypothetical protein n=1 Tax=Ruegeria atlantica TaxID=81569 RepID=UPI001C2C8840